MGRPYVACQEISIAGAAQPKFDDLVAQRFDTLQKFFDRAEASPKLLNEIARELKRLPRQSGGDVGFGRWLGDVVDSNLKNKRPDVAAVLAWGDHMVRVNFLQKQRPDGTTETAILFSDPNGNPEGTGKAKRLIVGSGAECVQYTATRCFDRLFEHRWKEDDHSTIAFTAFCPDVPLADREKMAYIQEVLDPTGKTSEQLFAARRNVLISAITDNMPELLHKVCDDLKKDGIEGKIAARQYLGADHRNQWSSVAYMVRDAPEMLDDLAACTEKLNVKGRDALFLLKDVFEVSRPALHRDNAEHSDAEVAVQVKRLGNFMENCEVVGDGALRVLESRCNHESILAVAAKGNKIETVKALLAESKKHGLTDNQRRQFLEARCQGELAPALWSPKTILDHLKRLRLTEMHDLIKTELDAVPDSAAGPSNFSFKP